MYPKGDDLGTAWAEVNDCHAGFGSFLEDLALMLGSEEISEIETRRNSRLDDLIRQHDEWFAKLMSAELGGVFADARKMQPQPDWRDRLTRGEGSLEKLVAIASEVARVQTDTFDQANATAVRMLRQRYERPVFGIF